MQYIWFLLFLSPLGLCFSLWHPLGFVIQQAISGEPVIQPAISQESVIPQPINEEPVVKPAKKVLHGRFLHITDIHPDPYYKTNTSTEETCHRGKKSDFETGKYGHPVSDCDSPLSLVDATFDWIDRNLKDKIDFIIWTGDNARHDNDNSLPRSETFIFDMNERMVRKFQEVFGSDDPMSAFDIPIVPSLGNNDVYPHNLFAQGPTLQTRELYRMWKTMVPEEQIHVFSRGVNFMVEVIPGKLAVLSINTLYWFKSNTLVDGCDGRKDPGHLQFRWLGIVLAELRARKMKVWLSGHVPPSPKVYESSCVDRLSAWLHEYRDIIVGGVYGHLNIDHVLFLDSEGSSPEKEGTEEVQNWDDGQVSILGKLSYMEDLKDAYSSLADDEATRYSVAFVSPSVIPTYLPGLRVWEYNTTGLDESAPTMYSNGEPLRQWSDVFIELDQELDRIAYGGEDYPEDDDNELEITKKKHGKKHKKNKKKKKKADPTWPPHFTDVALGPAYVPQTFTPTRYVQYFLNLSEINNGNQKFDYETEYTTDGAPYYMKDLLVKSWVKLARNLLVADGKTEATIAESDVKLDEQVVLNGKKGSPKVSRPTWETYLRYAFVSSGYEDLS